MCYGMFEIVRYEYKQDIYEDRLADVMYLFLFFFFLLHHIDLKQIEYDNFPFAPKMTSSNIMKSS